ncbi:MAG TPA: hypothetical protein P5277_04855 [Candidatus Paceibacterota bacterium]|nr:hypothetical protein [Candidatus Paceibacterota bacterium]
MVRQDIIAAIKNSVERGSSIEQAAQIMLNSGYSANDVTEAVNYLTGGVNPNFQNFLMPQQKSNYIPQQPPRQMPPQQSTPTPQQPSRQMPPQQYKNISQNSNQVNQPRLSQKQKIQYPKQIQQKKPISQKPLYTQSIPQPPRQKPPIKPVQPTNYIPPQPIYPTVQYQTPQEAFYNMQNFSVSDNEITEEEIQEPVKKGFPFAILTLSILLFILIILLISVFVFKENILSLLNDL